MHTTQQSRTAGPVRRVRHEVRDGLYVMGVSLASSLGLALLLTTLAHLGS